MQSKLTEKEINTLLNVKEINEIAEKHTLHGVELDVDFTEPWEVYYNLLENDEADTIELLREILELSKTGCVKVNYCEEDLNAEELEQDMEWIKVEIVEPTEDSKEKDLERLAKLIIKEGKITKETNPIDIMKAVSKQFERFIKSDAFKSTVTVLDFLYKITRVVLLFISM